MSADNNFHQAILQGIPDELPPLQPLDPNVSHAPRRKDILTIEEKKLAIRNALRYFDPRHHAILAPEFLAELQQFGRIYMYRFRPAYDMYARSLNEYPHKTKEGAAIMMMIQNNLDPAVAQHPHELITYGGNGAVFQNWAQYLLTMKYLATMTSDQTLHMYSGHPMGLFPSSTDAPRVVVTNGMMIPNYSKQDDWEKFNALGVTQYGQMTAGSYMYIGPQGIVHGTTITILNAGRKINSNEDGNLAGKLFVSSGLGGMSGAQPKAASIAGCISVVAEVNEKAIAKRHSQGWIDEVIADSGELVKRIADAKKKKEVVSIGYHGNIVTLWELLAESGVHVDLGSDQTSLHNPWAGGYYPVDMTFEQANEWIAKRPDDFKKRVQESLRRQARAINQHALNGTYFFDYGNAFLLEASRAGADVFAANGIDFRYPSYVQDIMGPMCFDYGFGPFRWVCASGTEEDLRTTDEIAREVLSRILETAPREIHPQLKDNLAWIEKAEANRLVVGSKARILYADAEGRMKIAKAFNDAIRRGKIGPVVLGRDHHDVSGTDSPYRETSNIYDGSRFTADMAIHNVIGDSFRGATWVSIHNGGGVGWGEVINGGFGLLLDGSEKADKNLHTMLYFDVTNGIARRAWARNSNALSTIHREHDGINNIKVTLPADVDMSILDKCFQGID
jgi:urocanate hydratase